MWERGRPGGRSRKDRAATDWEARDLPQDPFSRRTQSQDGAALVEFVLILPLALLILFGLIDFGFVFQGYTQMRNGTQAGARLAAENNSSYTYTGSTLCTGGPGGNTTKLLCSIISNIGTPVGIAAGSLNVGIAFTTPTNPNSETLEDDVTVCASGTLNSTTGFLAKLVVGTMSSSSTVLVQSASSTVLNYNQYNASSANAIMYGSVMVSGKNC